MLDPIDTQFNIIEKRLDGIEKTLESLDNKFSCFTDIQITNGGGRPQKWDRNVLAQFLYDRVTFKGLAAKVFMFAGGFLTILSLLQIVLIFRKGL